MCALFQVTNLNAQNSSFSFSGGISNSAIPIYSMKEESILLSSHSVSNLSFRGSYNRRLRKNIVLSAELAYHRIGGNSINRIPSQPGFFVHNVSLNYLSVASAPYMEFKFGRNTISLGLGPSISYLLNDRIENFQFEENVIVGSELESSDLKPLDFGVNGIVQFSRSIANNFDLILAVRKYQGLVDISRVDLGQKVYNEYAEITLGLNIPIN